MLSVFLLLVSFMTMAAPKAITIGFIPGDNPEKLKAQTAQLAQMLAKEINHPVVAYVSPDYHSLAQAMQDKKVDLAFFSASTYVQAEKELKLKVLLKKVFEGPFYYSVLLVNKQSKIRSLAALKSKKIAFVDTKSTSGYLYPMVMLKSRGIDPATYFSDIIYSGNHEKSVELISQGKVDAVTVFADDTQGKTGAIAKYLGADRARDFRVIWASEPIPNDPLCVREDFYEANPKLTHDVMFALIEANERWPKDEQMLKYLGIKQMTFATNKQYDPVRAMFDLLAKDVK